MALSIRIEKYQNFTADICHDGQKEKKKLFLRMTIINCKKPKFDSNMSSFVYYNKLEIVSQKLFLFIFWSF